MNWQRLAVLFLLLMSRQPARAQWKLLYSSQDVARQQTTAPLPDTTNQITAIESRGVLSKYLIVRHAHSRRELVAKNGVWGIVDGLGAVWRCYDKELFLVINRSDGWVEYAVERRARAWHATTRGVIMYSRTLDSKIKSNWSDAMADIPPNHILGVSRR